jgi:hypothetical protein
LSAFFQLVSRFLRDVRCSSLSLLAIESDPIPRLLYS